MRFRVIATLAVVVAAIGVLVGGVSNAAASTKTYEPYYNYAADPQTTNIPWVAWAGETVKVARCFGLGDSQVDTDTLASFAHDKGFDPLSVLTGEFDKSDWSGATDQPPFFQIGTGDETSRQVQAYLEPERRYLLRHRRHVREGRPGADQVLALAEPRRVPELHPRSGRDLPAGPVRHLDVGQRSDPHRVR